jgi:prepilin-type processing-associated H-X9-DG protein
MKTHKHVLGFTLLETIITMGILGLLVGLILFALQNSIRTARNGQCIFNLQQISHAVLLHESSFRTFPTGGWGSNWIGLSDRGFGVKQPGAWIFNTLPFLDLDDLRRSAPSCANSDRSSYSRFARTIVPIFLCPERGGNPLIVSSPRFRPPCTELETEFARNDYSMNAGNRLCRMWNGPRSLNEGDTNRKIWPSTATCTGISFPRSLINVKDIQDGLSHVIMCGEKWANLDVERDEGTNQSLFSGDCAEVRRETMQTPLRDSRDGSVAQFGSAHVGQANFTFCDGSIRSLSYEIDAEVFYHFGGRSDGTIAGRR